MQGQPGFQRGQPCRWPSDSPPQMLLTEVSGGSKTQWFKAQVFGFVGLGSTPTSVISFPLASFCFVLLFGLGASVSLSVEWVYFPGLL